tara:strand:+ start:294 stop:716 length:423 start_codon:yes stop_codon:yes gene_type:complete
MKIVIIQRFSSDEFETLGTATLLDENLNPIFAAMSLERGWLDNKPNESCVPEGKYKCVLEYSPRFNKDLWELKDVPNRSECKFHTSNYWDELNGCIALGYTAENIGKDYRLDVTNSRNTMDTFERLLKDEKEIIVIIEPS